MVQASPALFRFECDGAGLMIHIDAAYYRYTGTGGQVASRARWFPAIDPRDTASVGSRWTDAVDMGAAFTADFRLIGADGVSRWFRACCTPSAVGGERARGWSGTCVSIDDLKEEHAALEANEAGLRRGIAKQHVAGLRWREMQIGLTDASRLSAVGHMATNLAHELNQPLTAASTYAQAAVCALRRPSMTNAVLAVQAANDAVGQILRAGEIVRNLREFVATGECRRSRESLRTVIEEAAAFALIGVQNLSVAVHITLDATVQVYINRIQIQQVLINLIRNALEAMEAVEHRELSLTLRADGRDAIVRIADSGPGIDDELATRLFLPVVSAKPEGMGVGLSICRATIETHGGHIWLEPKGSGGAAFTFSLPMIVANHEDGGA